MKVKRLKQRSAFLELESLLKVFYTNKGDEYGLHERPESDYREYIDVIKRWTDPNEKVLDLGCGTFRTPKLLADEKFDVIGCDYFDQETLMEYKEKYIHDGLDFRSYDGNRLPFQDDQFDTIATLCVFEHVLDVENMLSEMNRVLNPGGHIIVLGPNIAGPHRIIRAIIKLIKEKKRYWQFESFVDCVVTGFKMFLWNLNILLSRKPTFLYVYPLMKEGKLLFEQSDDDAVQLNAPASFKKWFKKNQFQLKEYNSDVGDSSWTKTFNRLFPAFATKLQIVAQKIESH